MTTTIEYLAIAAVAIVLIISVVQATQLSSLNEKVSQKNTASATLDSGRVQAGASQGSVPQQTAPPSQQMVGGC
ncbi:MAG TPA: hypothetical protein HA254_01205 [Candidatus Diapherotrites archaeon]|uniref:Class III signal peptide-containing protein n=1 Tax=Candidatus Iainarchaeum sp. TaxID=3101447 RepID=A0A7J4J206_9ARCH|nr:hypothetical protein [Candidatus Diapherotrites archaeon]